MKYTIEYFIAKFDEIPKELWCTGEFSKGKKHCVLGWCGLDKSMDIWCNTESCALDEIFDDDFVAAINDGRSGFDRYGTHPKERILTALTEKLLEKLGGAI